MNRRSFLIAAAIFAVPATAAWADEDYVTELVDLLKKQGFSDIEVTRTLLGRVRIVGVNSEGTRELICNPRTGEILRDVLIADDGNSQTVASDSGSKGSSGNSGNSGNDDGNDDKDSGKDDDGGKSGDNGHHGDGDSGESDDDDSGHGRSGSNSGSGGSNSGHDSGHDD